jgi:hypothetical protein
MVQSPLYNVHANEPSSASHKHPRVRGQLRRISYRSRAIFKFVT